MAEFSARFYQDMTEDQFRAAAKAHGIEYVGSRNNTLVDAVYNAELQHRHAEKAAKDAKKAERDAVIAQDVIDDVDLVGGEEATYELDAMTNAELRDYANERGIDVSKAKSKADLLAAIEAGK